MLGRNIERMKEPPELITRVLKSVGRYVGRISEVGAGLYQFHLLGQKKKRNAA